jgi:hypothetical protein
MTGYPASISISTHEGGQDNSDAFASAFLISGTTSMGLHSAVTEMSSSLAGCVGEEQHFQW